MSSSKKIGRYKVLCGTCPDAQCKAKLFFPAHDPSIECSSCGQRHAREVITDIAEVTNPQVALHNMLKNILLGNTIPKKGSDTVKVLGVSNYQCKIISPLLTRYGMDKQTGQARLLADMGQGAMFDCGLLGDRAFLIEPEHIDIIGYGRDKTGSMNYLKDTLAVLKKYNKDVENILPIHADGDGHCLVHAVSRALIGRELFWHALRENLTENFTTCLDRYELLFKDFIDVDEWSDIIAECAPDFTPQEGEPLGLRNIHLFGLANVLKRPIILLDSLSGLQSLGDYTGTFLPGLRQPSECRSKDGTLNKPLCVAWSGGAHNHYIALVAVKGRELPRLPGWMVPKAWGVPNDQVSSYIDIDPDGAVTIGGNKCLQERYTLRLVQAMEAVFMREHNVSTSLVADVHQYVFKSTGIIGALPEMVIESTQKALSELRLYRCLTCDAIMEWTIFPETLRRGGSFYQLALETHGELSKDKHYSFPMEGLICGYDAITDTLVPQMEKSCLAQCRWCQGLQMRRVRLDGTPQYQNGDKTKNRTTQSQCECGFKHYWDDQEYDNLPEMLPVSLEWNGQVVAEKVTWFQYESDPTMNSNVYEVANKLVQKHFPGEFGSERLAQKVVDTILRQTAKKVKKEDDLPPGEDPLNQSIPTKIILTGQQSKSVHKEELNMSEAEKKVKANIESKASTQQKRKTDELNRKQTSAATTQATSPNRVMNKQQKIVDSPPDSGQVSKSDSEALMDTSTADVSEGDTPPSTAATEPKVREKKIRVTTSDGRQLQLMITSAMTFSDLQKRLAAELDIPAERQKYRLGFPPKPLVAPPSEQEGEAIAVEHGDRLMVEIMPDPNAKVDKPLTTSWSSPAENPWPVHEETRTSWSGFDSMAREHSASDMLDDLRSLHDGSDAIDMSIATLVMMAKLQGKELWTYVQGMPHLFSVGGLFYQQVKRDLTFTDGKHCTLPAIPGKVFRYNQTHDRLELCLEPHGHFPVEPGVEGKVMNESLINKAHSQGAFRPEDLGSGGSGVLVNPQMKYPGHLAFSGEGHSLRSSSSATGGDDHMPQELEPANHNHHKNRRAARFRTLSSGSVDEPIVEEDQPVGPGSEAMDTGGQDGAAFRRVGPGITVLEKAAAGEEEAAGGESNREILHKLTTCIEHFVEEHLDESTDSHPLGHVAPSYPDILQGLVPPDSQRSQVGVAPRSSEEEPIHCDESASVLLNTGSETVNQTNHMGDNTSQQEIHDKINKMKGGDNNEIKAVVEDKTAKVSDNKAVIKGPQDMETT